LACDSIQYNNRTAIYGKGKVKVYYSYYKTFLREIRRNLRYSKELIIYIPGIISGLN